jgi:hypothetical protein
MKPLLPKDPILSIIILNYNAGDYLINLFDSLTKLILTHRIEVILVDNQSTDGSFEVARTKNFSHPKINFIFHQNQSNLGFAWGNNQGIKISHKNSKYVLFLNPDTLVNPTTIQGMINFFENNSKVDAATCYVKLASNNQLQPECHRGFPNPWNTFWHFFGFGLPKLFPKFKLINGYFLSYLDYSQIQEIDCCVGAFFMMKRSVGQKVGWWNEKYFFYGEDLDFCYKLRQNGFKLFFIPDYEIIHYQGIASGIKKTTSLASRNTKVNSAQASTQAMRIFYQENLMAKYPKILHPIIFLGIEFVSIYRLIKAKYL